MIFSNMANRNTIDYTALGLVELQAQVNCRLEHSQHFAGKSLLSSGLKKE